MTTLVAQTRSGVVVARLREDGGAHMLDRPTLGRFREPYDGQPVVDGTPLHPVAAISPELTAACGWYEGQGRRLLLTHVAEPSFGEPMVFLAEGDSIVRAYPLDATRLLGENGAVVDIAPGAIRVTDGGTSASFDRSQRYRETSVTFGSQLAGTVIVPNTPGPHAAAVVVHGAAGCDRQFCRFFAQPLLDAGVAVLIYDKPADATIFQQADAASAGMDLLASRPEIDPHRVGLLGFSNGMWAVPMVAARRTDVAFLAGIGSPGVSMADCEVHRRTKVLHEAGVGAATVAAAGEAWRCLFQIAGTGGTTESITNRLDEALRTLSAADDLSAYDVPDYARENPMLSPIPPLIGVDDLVTMAAANHDTELVHDPAADYERIRCPVILQYGSRDSSIPVTTSVRQIEKALDQTSVRPAIHVYPGLEHMLNVIPDDVTGLTPEAAMYGFHRFRFGPGVWQDLTEWLRGTCVR